MRVKPILILLIITGFCLIHFELEAMDSNSVGGRPSANTTLLNGNPERKNQSIGPRNDFSRGSRKLQTYASVAAADRGKGESKGICLGSIIGHVDAFDRLVLTINDKHVI